MGNEDNNQNIIGVILAIIITIIAIWYFWGGGLEKQASKDMRQIEQQVATDAVKQYNIAKRSGNAMDAYIHAGLVAAAYLQAKDEANYRKWKKIEKQASAKAGMPDE